MKDAAKKFRKTCEKCNKPFSTANESEVLCRECRMDWLGSTDFFEAPASTRFHGSYEGGLCQHSLNVGKWLNKLAEGLYPGQYTKETLTLVALFHDVCKANCYKTSTRNVKNEQTGQWEKVPFFAWEEVLPFGGHGSKSMFAAPIFMMTTRTGIIPWILTANLKGR